MATQILMPRQGQTVEACTIVAWHKAVGDFVKQGESVCQIETDKAVFEVAAPADGVLLAIFVQAGEEAAVLAPIATVGAQGEQVAQPDSAARGAAQDGHLSEATPAVATGGAAVLPAAEPAGQPLAPGFVTPGTTGSRPVSPRARRRAAELGVPLAGVAGTGPAGRVVERDVLAAAKQRQPLTPAAAAMAGATAPPTAGSGVGGRITTDDLATAGVTTPTAAPREPRVVALRGARKLVADRMHASLQQTAQLTMTGYADATRLLEFRRRLKESPEELGLQGATVNDLVLFVVSRTLSRYPEVNAVSAAGASGEEIHQHADVHLGFAVDTERTLLVPVIRAAHTLSLRGISSQAAALTRQCRDGSVNPDALQGGTFTVTNLGSFGISSFTPVLNTPQAAILGVGGSELRPVQDSGGEVRFVPHLALSLTIDHRLLDGAPAARFLRDLSGAVANLDLTLAL